MGKIPVRELIAIFQRMYTEHWAYKSNAARAGCVDCSGAFVWAYKQFGAAIAHGSNAIARSYVLALLPISEAQPGMAAFKIRRPGDEKYKLPAKYQPGGSAYNGDLSDYYHIGLVDTDARYVLNAQSTATGFQRSPITQNWVCVGYLKAVEYGDEKTNGDEEPMNPMIVYAESGGTVFLRKRVTTDSSYIARVPVGTEVLAGDEQNGWRKVVYDGKTGYMMEKYLVPVSESMDGQDQTNDAMTLTEAEYNQLCDVRDQLAELRRIVAGIVGEG